MPCRYNAKLTPETPEVCNASLDIFCDFTSGTFIFDKIVFDADLLRGSDDGRYVKFARSKGNIVLMPARRMLPSAL